MSELYLSSPKIGEEGRSLFEKKYAEGDKIVTAQLRVDTTLRKIRNNASHEDLDKLEAIASDHLQEALTQTSTETKVDILDFFHLRIKLALIKQIIFAHAAFSSKDNFKERSELIDGTYGLVGEVLEEALMAYDNALFAERPFLTGIINELTALALLNRHQSSEHLAVPSDVTADLYNATDIEYLTLTQEQEKASLYHIQVKTRDHSLKDIRMPSNGILITASTMLNAVSHIGYFKTSRAIVAELNGTDTLAQTTHLTQAAQVFDTHMHNEISRISEESNSIHNPNATVSKIADVAMYGVKLPQ